MVPDDITQFVNSCFRAHGAKHRKYFPEFCRLAVGTWGIWVDCDMNFDDLVMMQQDLLVELYNRKISKKSALDFGLSSILYVAFNDDENVEYLRSRT